MLTPEMNIMTQHSFMLPGMVILENCIQRTYFKKKVLSHSFIHAGNQRTVDLLLRNGADANARTKDNNTPLILATLEGNFRKRSFESEPS